MPTFGEGQSEAKYRFNWHAPIVIDPFDAETLYTAAEVVFRSRDRGQTWEVIRRCRNGHDRNPSEYLKLA